METLSLGYTDSREGYVHSKRSSQPRIHHRHTTKLRDRLIILILVIVIGTAFGMTFDGSAAAASSRTYSDNITETNDAAIVDSGSPSLRYDVQHGDTLWQIATQHKPSHIHIHTYIDQLKQLNDVTDSVLYEGMLLILP